MNEIAPPAVSGRELLGGVALRDDLRVDATAPAAAKAPATETPAPPVAVEAASPPRKSRWKTALKAFVVLAVLGGLGVAALRYARYLEQFESTDDAYLDGRLHAVSTRVSGTVTEVLTDDNRVIHAGEPLLRLDARDYEVRLEEAKTDLLTARAAIPQAEAQIAQARSALEQTGASIAQTEAQRDKASLDLGRAEVLTKTAAMPQAEYDNANTSSLVAVANVAGARSARATAMATLRAAEANLKVAEARRTRAEAGVKDAELQLSYATVLAPTDGRVGKKSVEVGQRVQPGQALLAVIEPETWVVANFKENQLTRMRPGQIVEIAIDAVEGHTFLGKVESFSPGTGAKFSLLPPDNATGNFTKVVQRLPVKIRFDADSIRGYEDRLAPGLSVLAKVRIAP
jgi:membrane fusion protein (multidrug efflux system)